METRQVPRSVVRITLLEKDDAGVTVARTLYRKAKKQKKGSSTMRPIEKAMRRAAKATAASADRYLAVHERSNAKARDGWLGDLPSNLSKAATSGMRRLKVTRPLVP